MKDFTAVMHAGTNWG